MRKSASAANSEARAASERGDSRVAVFRRALDELVDSLDATVRVEAWREPDPVPEPLRASAAQLVARLGAANRLAAGRFSGSIASETRVRAIADAVRRLDTAYVVYRRSGDRAGAAGALNAAILEIKGAV